MSAEAYLKLIERTNEGCYFLWGPIRNALLMELAQGNTELIAEICTGGSLNRERRMPVERKDMLIQVLTMAVQGQGEKDREKHRARIHNLLEQIVEPGFRRQQMLGPRSFVETKKLAAQVAGQLQFSDILKPLMLDRDEDVRRTAVRSTFYLWKEDKALGLQILRELGDPDKVSHWLVPSIRRLHSCFELTLSILFEDYGEPMTTDHLHKIWAGVFGRILLQQGHRNEGRQPSSPRVVRLARSFVLRQVVNLAIRLARYLEKERLSVYDIREVELFFESSSGMDEVKQSFRRLVPYMDFRAGDLEDVKSDLERLTLSRDVLSCYLLATILGAHVSVRPKRTAAIIEELFEEAVRVEPGLPSIPMLIIALSSASDGKDKDEIDAEILELEEKIITQYQVRHDSISQGRGRRRARFAYSGLSSYPQYPYKKYGRVNPSVLNVFIENARTDGGYDRRKIHNYILNVTVPGHPQYRDLEANLASLEPILEIADSDQELQQDLIGSLARIRVYDSNVVDYFMNEQGISREVQEKVRNKCSEEEMASAVIGRGIFFIRDAILLQPEGELAQMFIRWLEQAPDCGSFTEWGDSLIKIVLNALCDDELFRL